MAFHLTKLFFRARLEIGSSYFFVDSWFADSLRSRFRALHLVHIRDRRCLFHHLFSIDSDLNLFPLIIGGERALS